MNSQEQSSKNRLWLDAEGPEPSLAEEPSGDRQRDMLAETGSVITAGGGHMIHCLTIIGQIEGHTVLPSQNKTTKYEHLIPQLVAIEEEPKIEGLLMLLNTVGGGGGHSIGVPLAVAAKKSFIAPSATMTIHPVRMNGLMLGVPQTLDYFQRMQDRITRFVTHNSHISPERFTRLFMNTEELVMDVGTVLEGADAVDCGLIDEVGSLSDALDALYRMIEETGKRPARKPTGKKGTKKKKEA